MEKFLEFKKTFNQKGQTLIVLIFILSVILVIGLAVASRSVSNIKISQQTQESARALWVAQAGLEKALETGLAENGELGEGVSYSVQTEEIGNQSLFVFPKEIGYDEPLTLWLVNHSDDGGLGNIFYGGNQLTFYWGKEGNSEDPALEALLIYKKGDTFYSKRYALAKTTTEKLKNFDTNILEGGNLNGVSFKFYKTVQLPTGANSYLVRLRLLCATNNCTQLHLLGVQGSSTLPKQGVCYESTGTVLSSGITRKLRECRLYETLPEIFDNLLYAGGELSIIE